MDYFTIHRHTSRGVTSAVPIALVLGAIIIGGAIYVTQKPTQKIATQQETFPLKNDPNNVRPVDATDWIKGKPNAPIVLIEYSDFECPFCKQYHSTMRRIMDEYGKNGEVAWVFRHFPIAELHSNAPKQALAAECAGVLKGNDAFWEYSNRIFEKTNGGNTLDMTLLPQFAQELDIEAGTFARCMEERKNMDAVDADFKNAIASGGSGTPLTIIITGGKAYSIAGAQPYPAVKAIIETLQAQLTPGDLALPSKADTATSVPIYRQEGVPAVGEGAEAL